MGKTLVFIASTIVLAAAPPTQTMPGVEASARKVIVSAIDAHGGRDNLKKRCRYHWRGEGVVNGPLGTATVFRECWVDQPDRLRLNETIRHENGEEVTSVWVYTGGRGWVASDGETRELPAEKLHQLDVASYVSLLPLLDNPALSVVSVPDTLINGRAASGVRVSGRGRVTAILYFDKETRLLAKLECRVIIDGKELRGEEYQADYKAIDGVRWPMKRTQVEGTLRLELHIKEVKHLLKVDPALFTKP